MNFIMKREKMTFNVPPEVRTEIKNYVKLLGFKSESDLCNKAINDYLTKLHYEANSDNINKILVQAVDSTIGTHTDRVSDILFKLAVSIEKHSLIYSGEYDDYYEEYIEEVARENVQKRHGRL